MSKFRSQWLALFGGAALIALSLSTALGAKPAAGDNRGQLVSAFVHSLGADVEETDTETTDETETTDDTETEDETDTDTETEVEVEEVAASDHGACVRAVAQDKEAVDGDNNNHGGAVSQAARVDCWPDEVAATDEEAATDDSADDSEESAADETETSTAAKVHDKSPSKGHGKGHSKKS